MNYGNVATGQLAATGAGLAVGGYYIGSVMLAGIAIALVAIGGITIRLSFRRGRTAGQK